MTIKDLVAAIAQKHTASGFTLHPPATPEMIDNLEQTMGFELPPDFREFYFVCNGFSCDEDIFNMIPLDDIRSWKNNYGAGWFVFSEYMIYSGCWALRKTGIGEYEIFSHSGKELMLTRWLYEFLQRFYQGNVFEEGGLEGWEEEISSKNLP